MEVQHVFVGFVEDKKRSDYNFFEEMAKGQKWAEMTAKEEELKEYEKAYHSVDKDSFNAQYMEVIISNLKDELRAMKN